MAKASKLPSGAWRVKVYTGTDDSGKKIYASITAPTKAEAELKAAEVKAGRRRIASGARTVLEAVRGYIDAKAGVLSPSTLKAYESYYKTAYDSIGGKPIAKLTSEDLQIYISRYAASHSAKTTANAYGLLTAAIGLYLPDARYKVTLPTRRKIKKHSPSTQDIQRLMDECTPRMRLCIALAAFGSMRRGEICALTYGDIKGSTVHVHADMVQGPDKAWTVKPYPKTAESDRVVTLPPKVMRMIGTGPKDARITDYATPTSVTNSFCKLRDRLGLSVRFHDLRHYFVSIAVALGIPAVYVAEMGGWRKDSPIMRDVYQHSIAPESKRHADKLAGHFEGLL